MRLLNITENNEKKQSELARDHARTESVRLALEDAQYKLNEVEARFDLVLAKQQEQLAKEEEKYILKIDVLKKEVRELEDRRKITRFPIAPAERKAYDNLEKSKQVLLESELQKKKNEEIGEKLEDNLDSLSDRDNELDSREIKIKTAEMSLDSQKDHIKFLSESLAEKWKEFYSVSNSKDNEFNERERIIGLHSKDLDMREDRLLENKSDLIREREKLDSDRQTLRAAFDELRQKNGTK